MQLTLDDHFEQTFSWMLAFGLYAGEKTIRLPYWVSRASVRFRDASGKVIESDVTIPLPEKAVAIAFRRGALVVGNFVVHDLPWLTESEQERSWFAWEEEDKKSEEAAQQRRAEMHRSLSCHPMLENGG